MRIDETEDDRLAGQVTHGGLIGDPNVRFPSDRHNLAGPRKIVGGDCSPFSSLARVMRP
jgi:hypothetical protein